MGKRTKHLTDEEIVARIEKDAPEVLSAKVNFDALVGKVLAAGSVDIGRAPKQRKQRASQKPKPAKSTKSS
jgi:hypothetical protein